MPEQRKAKIKQFLDVTRDIESSDGKNFNHPEMQGGMHQGQSAIGSYGLMPNTIKEFANRLKTPELLELQNMSPEAMKARIESDPELEARTVEPIAGWILDKYGGDPRMANYAYQYGHNLPAEKVKARMEGSDRDAKFLERYKEPVVVEEQAPSLEKEQGMFDKIKGFFSMPNNNIKQ